MAPPTSASNPFEEEEINLTPISQKSYLRQPSALTLPPATMESISRTTTAAGTPLGSGDLDSPLAGHPFSAFYNHPQCAVSSETSGRKSTSTREKESSWEKDLEKGEVPACPSIPKDGGASVSAGNLGVDLTPSPSGRPSFDPSVTTTQSHAQPSLTKLTPTSTLNIDPKTQVYCTVWPAGSEVRQRKKEAQRMKGCALFRKLTRKQKIIAKVCIAVLILGLATVIGVCISYKTGGLVWKSSNNYGTIGS